MKLKQLSKAIMFTHCKELHCTNPAQLENYNELTCAVCDTPVLIKGFRDGKWYYVGEQVFKT